MTLVRPFASPARLGPPASLLRRLFRLSPRQAEFATRGFTAHDEIKRQALEDAGRAFIGGYNSALAATDLSDILDHVADTAPALRGFAAEGATMGVAIADAMSLRRAQLPAFLAVTERDFTYLAHVGAGWALARTPWRRHAILASLDAVHHWLAYDGLGFHDAYFSQPRMARGWRRITDGYAARVYDQGIGRAIWFVSGGDVAHAERILAALPASRHGDLWSGLGLAMAYAGPASDDDFNAVLTAAGAEVAAFSQGVAFACEARVRAGVIPGNTDNAARVVLRRTASAVAGFVRDSRHRLPGRDGAVPRYEMWRRDVASAFQRPGASWKQTA
ncbi:MAG: DUF1702 family protein [Proteobacteria bacterium]|nr:DUF1702 family protein [Pseudomonadota bacterium]